MYLPASTSASFKSGSMHILWHIGDNIYCPSRIKLQGMISECSATATVTGGGQKTFLFGRIGLSAAKSEWQNFLEDQLLPKFPK